MLFACKMMQFTALNPTNNHAKCRKKQDELIGIATKNHGILHNFPLILHNYLTANNLPNN